MNRVINRDISERGKNKEVAKNEFLKSWQIYYGNKHKNRLKNLKFVVLQKKQIIINC